MSSDLEQPDDPQRRVEGTPAESAAPAGGDSTGTVSESADSTVADSEGSVGTAVVESSTVASASDAAESESAASDETVSVVPAAAESEARSDEAVSEAAALAAVALVEGVDVADAVARAAGVDELETTEPTETTAVSAVPTVSSATTTVARPTEPEVESEPEPVDASLETIVHVLRHGEVHNPKGILYGRLPGFSLSVTGRAQAGAVARALSDHDLSVVIASPLQRAQETAEPIASQHGLVVRTDENLIEAGNTFEGLRVSVGDGALRKPRHWWKLRDPFTPSWGEPYLQIAHRMLAAVNKARVEAAGHEAVLVSHQLPVWTLRRFLQGQRLWHDPRQRQCSLASLTSLVYQGDTLVDIVYSEPAGGSDPSVHGA